MAIHRERLREKRTSIKNYSDFQKLPEGCIANVLSFMSPKDACRLSSVNSTFRSAAESDVVWERLLPPDCRQIISRSIDGADSLLAKFRTKKEFYIHLCHNPILIDGSTKVEDAFYCFSVAVELFIGERDWKEVHYAGFKRPRYYMG